MAFSRDRIGRGVHAAVAMGHTGGPMSTTASSPVSAEHALLKRWSEGELAAGQELFRDSYAVVTRYFRNKVNDAQVSDLVQKTFLACVASVARFKQSSRFATYVLAIAHHTLVDHYRASALESGRSLDLDGDALADAGPGAEVMVGQRQDHRLLLGALRRLPFSQQVVLELRYWEALSDTEIAEVLDVPLGTVKTRLRAGQARLRDELAREDVPAELLRTTLDTLDRWSARVGRGAGDPDRTSEP
jgi:RNA polymerase sigma factor (sigma-70 family)